MNKQLLHTTCSLVLGFAVMVTGTLIDNDAHALLIGVAGGNGEIIAAPANVLEDGTSNDRQQGFNERQGVLLGAALSVDGGTISAGTVINSHMIFLNTDGNIFGSDTNTWTFDGDILGVMTGSMGTDVVASAFLNNLGTAYEGSTFTAYGLESNDSISFTGNTVTLFMQVREPGDWIRVITTSTQPVPEPSTMLLLGSGLVGLVAWRRKKK